MTKHINLLIVVLLTTLALFSRSASAQAPQAIPYQAVARDASGNLIATQNVSLRFSLHDATATGSIVYQETQNVTTNNLGLFSINLGQGTPISGTMAAVNWTTGAKFLQVELDPAGGTSYTSMGTTQLMSVPYALNAVTSNDNKWLSNGNNISNTNTGNVGIGTNVPDALLHLNDVNGTQNAPSANLVLSRVWNNPTDTRASSIFHYYNGSTFQDNLAFGVSGDGGNPSTPNALSQIKMMIQSDGNVGIGTTTPQSMLHIVKAGSPTNMTIGGTGYGMTSMNLSTSASMGGSSEIQSVSSAGSAWGDLILNNNGGNVGIGTTTPTNKLSVNGNANVIGQIVANTGGHGIVQTDGTTSVGTYADASAGWVGTNSNHPLYFYTANGYESMTVATSGNIGIGTNNPQHKLNVVDGANNTALNVDIASGDALLQIKSPGTAYWTRIGTNGSPLAIVTQGNDKTTAAPTMFLNNNGNVGIGITSSPTYKLAVGGRVICTELRVQATPFPDYVFDEAYHLKPLEEVEAHINTYHRLPNMPPATEVETDGMNVGGIQLKLVEKVEELTLYLLQQQKELKAQKIEIEQLRTQLNSSKN